MRSARLTIIIFTTRVVEEILIYKRDILVKLFAVIFCLICLFVGFIRFDLDKRFRYNPKIHRVQKRNIFKWDNIEIFYGSQGKCFPANEDLDLLNLNEILDLSTAVTEYKYRDSKLDK